MQILEAGRDAVSLSHGLAEEPVLGVVGEDWQGLEAFFDVVGRQVIFLLILVLREDVRGAEIALLLPLPLQRPMLLREETRHLRASDCALS